MGIQWNLSIKLTHGMGIRERWPLINRGELPREGCYREVTL